MVFINVSKAILNWCTQGVIENVLLISFERYQDHFVKCMGIRKFHLGSFEVEILGLHMAWQSVRPVKC